MNIYYSVLAQVLRAFLLVLAGYLARYGVDADMQSELVEAIITAIVPVILFIVVNYWSFIYKRYLQKLIEVARKADPDTPIELLKSEAKFRSSKIGRGSLGSLLLVFAIGSSVLLSTGCPKQTVSIRNAKKASVQMAKAGTNVIQANIDAVKSGEISPAEFEQLNKVTKRFVDGVAIYREAVRITEEAIAAGGDSGIWIAKLEKIFQSNVLDTFVELADKYGVIKGANSPDVRAAIDAIRISISTIRIAFSTNRSAWGSTEVTS